jgi:hypothetical protein
VNEVESEAHFLGDIRIESIDEEWSATVNVNGTPTIFKLDSGAAVSVMGTKHVSQDTTHHLQPATKKLRGAGNIPIDCLGTFQATLSYEEHSKEECIYVIRHQSKPLLSRRACASLGLLSVPPDLHEVSSVNFREEFSSLFKGLGCLDEKFTYSIALTEPHAPLCLFTPKKFPHPLRSMVKQELDSMTKTGVISPVSTPTSWCSGMVCVPKANKRVRICVDLTQLNRAVKREIHPISAVDDSLSQLAGSQVFTKLDANSGFWQIPLDSSSKLLTTFITPFGRFCFNRLPFGISSAPEIFQCTMSTILEGIPGVICHMDDILIHASEQEVHEREVREVREVLGRLKDANITLNNKCKFSKTSMKFLGHITDTHGLRANPDKTNAFPQFSTP